MAAEGHYSRQEPPVVHYEAQLVRKGNGSVVYMECDHDLVAQLSAFLHLPIGTLGNQLKQSAAQLGIVHFASSIAGLRSAVWDGKKESMLPSDRPPTSGKVKAQRMVANMPPKLCLCETGVNVQHGNIGNGVCRICHGGRRTQAEYYGGRPQSTTGSICATCQTCPSCAKAIFTHAQNHVTLADDSAALEKRDKAPSLPAFKDTVKFLIDNQLRVFENSSVKALQLLSAARVDLSDIVTEERVVTKAEIGHLVAYMLFNSDKILTSVFPAH
jgi:hypothetical protein